ncbi:MAG: DUF3307 domain-containing protein [Draconibacterium sp.]
MILLKLVFAHLLGDFILQPDAWVVAKEQKKWRAWQLYAHVGIHFALICLFVWQADFIAWTFLLTFLHFTTDILKLYFQKPSSKRTWFFADQIIHLSAIVLIWAWSQSVSLNVFSILGNQNFLLLITCLYALTQPVSVLIRIIISKWTPDTGSNNTDSLVSAGNFIGILERLFVFAFVIAGKWEAIGFLLAAKSIFRFGDLKEAKDRKLTEYVLIGTLLSFGIALLMGILFNFLQPMSL